MNRYDKDFLSLNTVQFPNETLTERYKQHYTKDSSAKRLLTNAQITPTMTGDEKTDKMCKSMWEKKKV